MEPSVPVTMVADLGRFHQTTFSDQKCRGQFHLGGV
jgi:hypothetical protein